MKVYILVRSHETCCEFVSLNVGAYHTRSRAEEALAEDAAVKRDRPNAYSWDIEEFDVL